MPVEVKLVKTLVLTFELPGYRGGGTSRTSRHTTHPGNSETPYQLEHEYGEPEHWRLVVATESALVVRETFLVLAAKIAEEFKLGNV